MAAFIFPRHFRAILGAYFILLGVMAPILAQEATRLKLRNYSIRDGLSQNTVHAMIQDRMGFLWVGTEDGLNKFDGRDFKIYRYSPHDPTSLTPGTITAIQEDSYGRLWVGTDHGLNLFDPGAESNQRLSLISGSEMAVSIRALHPHSDQDMWVGTQDHGLFSVDLESLRCKSVFVDETIRHVTAIYQDSRSTTWVGTVDGLFQVSLSGERQEVTVDAADPAANTVHAITEDDAGRLWLATRAQSVYRLDADKVSFHQIPFPDPITRKGRVRASGLVIDKRGTLWMSISGFGVVALNTRDMTWKEPFITPEDPYGLKEPYCLSLTADQAGGIWVGAWSSGIYRFTPTQAFFEHFLIPQQKDGDVGSNDVFACAEVTPGQVWVGTYSHGLYRIQAQETHAERLSLKGLTSQRIYSLLTDPPRSTVWIGTWDQGLFQHHLESGLTTRVEAQNEESDDALPGAISALCMDHEGGLWVGTHHGLFRRHPESGGFEVFRVQPDRADSLPHPVVTCLLSTSEGELWVGTENGLARFDPTSRTFQVIRNDPDDLDSLGGNLITALVQDQRHNLWVSTSGGGLNRLDPQGKPLECLLTSDGFPSNTLYSILEDEEGQLWCGTNRGLVRYNPGDRSIRVFTENQGLQSNEFNLGAACATSSGAFLMGGINGVNRFNPGHIHRPQLPPPMAINELTVISKSTARKLNPLDQQPLQLHFRDRAILVDVVAFDFSDPDACQYAYRIEPVEDEWVHLGKHHALTLGNLEPGDYTLRIKGTNAGGVWNEQGIAIPFIVNPPFWATWWFRFLIFLAIVAIAFAFHRKLMERQRRTLRKENMKVEFCRAHKITDRELEIIELIIQGKTNKEIEETLFISVGTVKNHIYNIFKKLDIKNRTQLSSLLSDWTRPE